MLANAAAIVRLSWSDGATPSDRANLERIKSAAADIAQDHKILRALLAAGPEAKAPPSDAVAAPKAARPKGDIWDACGCPNPDDCEHVFYEPAPSDAAVREAAAPTTYCPDCSVQGTTAGCWTLRLCDQHRIDVSFVSLTPPPAGAEVREAAERLRAHLGVTSGKILYRHKSGTLHRQSDELPYGVAVAELCDEDGITFAGSEVIEFALLVLDALAALDAARGGAS